MAVASWGRAHSPASVNSSADICCDLVTGTLHHSDTVLMNLKPSCEIYCRCKWNVVQRWEGTFAGASYNNQFCSPHRCFSFHCAEENNNEHVAINSHLCWCSCFMEQLPPQDGCKGKQAESGSLSFPSGIRFMSHKQAGVRDHRVDRWGLMGQKWLLKNQPRPQTCFHSFFSILRDSAQPVSSSRNKYFVTSSIKLKKKVEQHW